MTSPHMSGIQGASGLPDSIFIKKIIALMIFSVANLRLIPINISNVLILIEFSINIIPGVET